MKTEINCSDTVSTHAKKSLLTALLLVGIASTDAAHAFATNTNDYLTINSGVTGGSYGYVTGGSYFTMDYNGNGTFQAFERTAIQQGTQGIIIGVTQSTGMSHTSFPTGTEGGTVDAAWSFFGNTGMHFTQSPITGDTTSGLNFSGWRVTWNGIPSINMGGGLQNCGTASDGICMSGTTDVAGTYHNGTGFANFSWDGVYGHAYSLNYSAVVPLADPSGFGGVPYGFHFEGTVNAVPVPAAVWLFGSGLIGLLSLARRRRA